MPRPTPVGIDFIAITVSVGTIASARTAGVGPFTGLFFKVSTSITVVSISGASVALNDVARNTILWLSGAFVSVIATATSQFGVL